MAALVHRMCLFHLANANVVSSPGDGGHAEGTTGGAAESLSGMPQHAQAHCCACLSGEQAPDSARVEGSSNRRRVKGVLNLRARESPARTESFQEKKLISGDGLISSRESQPGAANGLAPRLHILWPQELFFCITYDVTCIQYTVTKSGFVYESRLMEHDSCA